MKLPRAVTDAIEWKFVGTELVSARKEAEGGKECYAVRISDNGQLHTYYVSPDGSAIARKDEFSFAEWVKTLILGFLLILLPGSISGAVAIQWIRVVKSGKSSVLSEWSAAWIGAVT